MKVPIAYDNQGLPIYGAINSEVGFTGHHHHVSSGLILTWYRAYDPEYGRWLSADPIREVGGLNLYAYVDGNPVSYMDLFGLLTFSGTVGRGLGLNFHLGVNGGQFQWGVAFGLAGGASLDLNYTDSGCRSTDGEIYMLGKVSGGGPLLGAGADAALAFELNETGNSRFEVNGSGTIAFTTYGGSATHIKGEGWRNPKPKIGKKFPLGIRDFHFRRGLSGFLGVGLRGARGSSCPSSFLP